MVKKILLHVGAPKCGSTFLQEVLRRNADRLSSHGIHYPIVGDGHPGNASSLRAFDEGWIKAKASDGIHTVILSHEDLLFSSKEADRVHVAKLTAELGIDVSILVFIRPFSQMVFGDYSQHMKQFFKIYLKDRLAYDGLDFENFSKTRIKTFTLFTALKTWRDSCGDADLVIMPHTRIRDRLSSALALDLDWNVPKTSVNLSLRIQDCEKIAAAMTDADLSDEAIRTMFFEAFVDAGSEDAGKTQERIDMIESLAAEENARLLEVFGYDNRLMQA